MTLVEFLLTRIAEDEAAADHGRSHPDPTTFARDDYGYLWVQPERVLAECEAKRRIVEMLAGRDEQDRPAVTAHATGLRLAVKVLAEVYADHPDYRDEWLA